MNDRIQASVIGAVVGAFLFWVFVPYRTEGYPRWFFIASIFAMVSYAYFVRNGIKNYYEGKQLNQATFMDKIKHFSLWFCLALVLSFLPYWVWQT